MKKFIISEEEKKRILGMHVEATKRHYGLVNEQSSDSYESTLKNTLVGKTFNLYRNPGNTGNVVPGFKVVNITDIGAGAKPEDKFFKFQYTKEGDPTTYTGLHRCGTDKIYVFTFDEGGQSPEWIKISEGGEKFVPTYVPKDTEGYFYYNKPIVDTILENFCTGFVRNSAGQIVPKADFAQTKPAGGESTPTA